MAIFFGRNKQPPSSGLGTASPAFVEARMYAPPNAANKKVLTTNEFTPYLIATKLGKYGYGNGCIKAPGLP